MAIYPIKLIIGLNILGNFRLVNKAIVVNSLHTNLTVGRPKLSDIAVCRVSVASLRRYPAHNAVLISQILFGEYVSILSKKKDWYRVQCKWDSVVGWIDAKQFYVVKESEQKKIVYDKAFALEHFHSLSSDKITFPISLGSDLGQCDGLNVKLPFSTFRYSGQIVQVGHGMEIHKLLSTIVRRFIHCPHLEGGRSIMGVDGAGLIQIAYKMIGHNLPRSVQDQSQQGFDIGFANHSQVGDLAFFHNGDQVIHHAGMILNDNQVIHVHGQVRIDHLDHQGIYDKQSKKYIFLLKTIRRIIKSEKTAD